MPATIDGLSADLRRFFEERLQVGQDEGPGTARLVFDALGYPLSVREFTGPAGAASSDVFARQRAAELADQLPAASALASGAYLARSGGRLSDWYAGAIRAGTSSEAGFDLVKAEALKRLDDNRWVVLGGGLDTRYATSLSPLDFYKTEFDGWQRYSVSSGDEPPPDTPAGPEFRGRVFEGPMQPGLVVHGTLTEHGPNELDFSLPERASDAGNGATAPAVAAGVPPSLPTTTSITAAPPGSVVPLIHAREPRLSLAELIADFRARIDPAVEVALGPSGKMTPTSGSFAVDFEFCPVRFERPWWHEPMLARTDWHVGGVERGGISSGTSQPSGPVTLLTTGMLVVRRLSITAQWTEGDLEALPDTVSLGPFCLVAGTFDKASGTITREGLQVIGWLCEVPPVLPPAG
ncbi:hypothetical protein [Streptomyces sp. bgisy091]|uniref:hypothetical protein n=1 Tax=Streptomyces sp. bgisy091 TaxID=3413778 RepID=UPI003D717F80